MCFYSLTLEWSWASKTQKEKKRILWPLVMWNESLPLLWAEEAPGVSNRGCLCCQSQAEQWLRLISILMNANWHICYGGLAVQTLQLAWLINYPPAGGSLEMGNGWGWGRRGGWEDRWKCMRKKNEQAQTPSLDKLGFSIWLENISTIMI